MKSFRFVLIISSFLIIPMVNAQSISRSVLGSAGSTLTTDSQRITWTIGEPVTGIMTASGHQLGSGFYQSLDLSVLLIKPDNPTLTSIEVFPNPANENITIRHNMQHDMTVRINGQDNKLIWNKKITSGDLIDVSNWKQGVYFLNVIDNVNQQETIFKIVIL